MPASWSEYTLKEVCLRITDGAHQSPKSVDIGMPMASVKDLTPFGINIETCRKISEQDFKELVRQNCQPKLGDILVAKDGATALDTVCEIRQNLEVVLLSSVAIFRPDLKKIHPGFLRYYLDCDTTRAYLKNGFITGAAIPRVVLEDFKRARINLPPIPTQRKIAAILSAYDDLIENNTRRIKILEEMAQALYRDWFVKFRFPGHENVPMVDSPLGEIPEGWEVKRLGDIAKEVRRGVSPDKIDPETPYLGLEHLPRKSIALSEWGSVKEVNSTKLVFKKGEILFGKIRPYFHKVGVAPIDGVCSSDIIVILSKSSEYFSITLACVSSEEFVMHATQTSKGTKMPRADWGVLENYAILIPPSPMLHVFDKFFRDSVDQIHNMIFKNRNLRSTRDHLLTKLISGEINIENLEIRVEGMDS